jgi:hypothetical protein
MKKPGSSFDITAMTMEEIMVAAEKLTVAVRNTEDLKINEIKALISQRDMLKARFLEISALVQEKLKILKRAIQKCNGGYNALSPVGTKKINRSAIRRLSAQQLLERASYLLDKAKAKPRKPNPDFMGNLRVEFKLMLARYRAIERENNYDSKNMRTILTNTMVELSNQISA